MGDGPVQYSAKLKVLSETGLVIGSGVGMTGKEASVEVQFPETEVME